MEEVTQHKLKELRIILDSNEVKNYFQKQNFQIEEETDSDEPTEVNVQEYQEEINSEVDSTTLAVEQLEDKHEDRKTLFSCSLCNKNKMRLASYKLHLTRSHHLSKEEVSKYVPKYYQCKICHRQFKNPSLLHRHEGSHTLPFECDICDKRFSENFILKTHKISHAEPQFLCHHCTKKFKRKFHLINHIERHHSESVGKYKCNFCKEIFKSIRYLLSHVKLFHSAGNIFWKCNECGHVFQRKISLKKHISDCHTFCSLCGKQFTVFQHLKHHIETQHTKDVRKESRSQKTSNAPKTCTITIDNTVPEKVTKTNESAKTDSKYQNKRRKQNFKIREELSEKNKLKNKPIYEVTLQDYHQDIIKASIDSTNRKLARAKKGLTQKDVANFKCYVCPEKFITTDFLKEHLSDCHSLSLGDVLTKDVNDKRLIRTPLIRTHLIRTRLIKELPCPESLTLEDVVHFTCHICSEKFTTFDFLKQHMFDCHHSFGVLTTNFNETCPNEELHDPDNVTMQDVTPEVANFRCHICSEKFTTTEFMKQHLSEHHNLGDVLTAKCPYEDVHSPENECMICNSPHSDCESNSETNKTCSKKSNMTYYEHSCPHCDKKLDHDKLYFKDYKCDKCEKYFKCRHNLLKHFTNVHHSEIENKYSPKPNNDLKTCNNSISVDNIKEKASKLNEFNPTDQNSKFQNHFFERHLQIREAISAENVSPEIQPLSELYLQECHEENIKTELDTTLTDEVETTDEKDVEIETEITIDEMDWSILKTEESPEKAYSEGQSVNLALDDSNKIYTLAKNREHDDALETTTENDVDVQPEITIDEMDHWSILKTEESSEEQSVNLALDDSNKIYTSAKNLEQDDAFETTTENDVDVKPEITIDEVDVSTLEESSEKAYSVGPSVNLVLDHSSKNETLARRKKQVMQIEDKDTITKYSCYICKMNYKLDNTFNRLIDLKMHLTKIHNLSKEEILKYVPHEFYKCKYCHREFKTPSGMLLHEGSHTRPFKCDDCDKSFGYKSCLKAHKLIHTEPKLRCPNCDIIFRRTDRLNSHIKSQHCQSYYKCDQCEKKYKRKYVLKIHVETQHSSSSGSSKYSSWKCDTCKKIFMLKSYLKKHIIEYHINVIKCLYCNKKFKSKHDYIRHINKQHNSNKIKPKNDSKTCIHPKEKVSRIQSNSAAADVPEIQPFSEVYLQEYHEGNIKTEPKSPSHSTVTDEVETTNEIDVDIKTEIITDEMDWSAVKAEESTEKSHS